MSALIVILACKIPLFIVGLYYIRHLSKPYLLVFSLTMLALFTEIAGHLIVRILGQYNIWLFNLFSVTEVLVMSLAAYLLLKTTPFKKYILPITLFALLTWLYGVYSVGIAHFHTPAVLTQFSVLVLLYLVVLYYAVFQREGRLRTQPQFWLSLSVILFFGCNLPYYGFFNYLNDNHPDVLEQLFHPIIWTLNFIRYPMVAVSLYLAGKQNSRINTL